jgi:hypothetical protein
MALARSSSAGTTSSTEVAKDVAQQITVQGDKIMLA